MSESFNLSDYRTISGSFYSLLELAVTILRQPNKIGVAILHCLSTGTMLMLPDSMSWLYASGTTFMNECAHASTPGLAK
jgi:hypothetical protein